MDNAFVSAEVKAICIRNVLFPAMLGPVITAIWFKEASNLYSEANILEIQHKQKYKDVKLNYILTEKGIF